jgi:DNA-directed RNA polymerase specialized sigma24 family protein
METFHSNMIRVYPKKHEVQFSGLSDEQIENFSADDQVTFDTGDMQLRQSIVFVERFFNKVPCRELAERFGVKENTIVSMYKNGVAEVQRLIKALDSRKAGPKALKPARFTDEQKWFLLVHVFGFSGLEVARMFRRDKTRVAQAVKRHADRYQSAFEQVAV